MPKGVRGFQKGNPGGGRKKGVKTIESEKAREFIILQICKHLRPIIDKLIEDAKNGDKEAIKILFDRGFGKPKEFVEHSGSIKSILEFVTELEKRK